MVAVLKHGFSVRNIQEADVPAIMEIELASYPFPWSSGIFKDCIRVGYHCLALEIEREIAGYSILSIAVEECHILNFCIASNYRGQGLGRSFMEYLLEHAICLGAKAAHLEVRPSNTIARNLYLSMGFTQVGLRKAYYPAVDGREDALVLATVFEPIKNFSQ